MNVFAKFNEIPSMILKVIKETKRYAGYGHTVGWSDGRSDNVKTVYPPTNTVCGGYKSKKELECSHHISHYKSMGTFPDDQGQLSPQSLV